MPFDKEGQPFDELNSFFGTGVVVSFDLVVDNLKRYYSAVSPQGAYAVIAKEFESHGFEKLGDSDYRHSTMTERNALKMIADFSQQEKWFPANIRKIIVSPDVPKLDISDTIREIYSDMEWIKKKDNEYAQKM